AGLQSTRGGRIASTSRCCMGSGSRAVLVLALGGGRYAIEFGSVRTPRSAFDLIYFLGVKKIVGRHATRHRPQRCLESTPCHVFSPRLSCWRSFSQQRPLFRNTGNSGRRPRPTPGSLVFPSLAQTAKRLERCSQQASTTMTKSC